MLLEWVIVTMIPQSIGLVLFFGLLAERKVCVRAAASLEVIGAAATGLCNLTWWYMELVAAQLGSAHAPS